MKLHHQVAIAAFLLALPQFGGAQTVTYTGEAAAVSANVLGIIDASISDTGALPTSGGSLSAELASLNVPGLLNLNLLTAAADGENSRTNSQASVADALVTVAGIRVTASVLTSNAAAACYSDHATASGTSTIVNLNVNGLSVRVTGTPNQTIPLLIGSLIINEQISSVNNSPNNTSGDMLVNALHLRVDGIADVVISSSHAGASCSAGGRRT